MVVMVGMRYWSYESNECTKAPPFSPWNCPNTVELP